MRARTALLAGALVVVLAPAAHADAPERTGWWSAASGGGVAVPQPTAAEGDLRVARALQTQALAALVLRADGATGITLTLGVRDARAAGTPDVVACPTVLTDWAEGGNQPIEDAPEVDCSLGTAFALPSEDGATISWGLDRTMQAEPGVWSVALLPQDGGTVPFTVDLFVPEEGAFTVDGVLDGELDGVVLPGGSDPEPVAQAPVVPLDSGTSFDAGSAFPGIADVPGGEVPLLAGALPEPQAAPPVVDMTVAPSQARSGEPVLAAAPTDALDRARTLAVLALVGLAWGLGRVSAEQVPAPRLLGGRARLAPAVAAGAVPVRPSAEDRPRGIGRFARVRDAAPRRLR